MLARRSGSLAQREGGSVTADARHTQAANVGTRAAMMELTRRIEAIKFHVPEAQ